MTAAEKVEQRTLTALTTGRWLPGSARPLVRNHLVHWGTGAALGALRGVWSASGLRGWRASAWHTLVTGLVADRLVPVAPDRDRAGTAHLFR
jgi:hypothetical protein